MKVAIIAIALLVGALALDCNNPLLTQWSIPAQAQPVTYTGTYCTNLQGSTAKSCCAQTDIDKVQTKSDEIKSQLTEMCKKRDKLIVDTAKQVLPGIQQAINSVNTGVQEMKANSDTAKQTKGAAVETRAAPFIQAAQQVVANADTLKSQFKEFQKARAKCYTTLLDIQASAYCLACDADYANRGVNTDGTINIGTDLCTRVKQDCFGFLRASIKQSSFIALKKSAAQLAGLANMTSDLQGKPRPAPPSGLAPPPPTSAGGSGAPPVLSTSTLQTGTAATSGNLPIPGGDPTGSLRGAVGQTTQQLLGVASQSDQVQAIKGATDAATRGFTDALAKIKGGPFKDLLPNTIAAAEALKAAFETQKTAASTVQLAGVSAIVTACQAAITTFQSAMQGATTELQALLTKAPADIANMALSAASNYANANLPTQADGLPAVQTGLVSSGPEEQEIKTPQGCDSDTAQDSCAWLCNNLINSNTGKIDLKKFGAGGPPNDQDDTLAPSTPVASSRRLATTSTTWGPTKGESGTTASFSEDASGTSMEDNKSSAANIFASVFTVLMMAITYIMI